MAIRITVYYRVSTETEMQQHSLGVQRAYYEDYVRANNNYELVGLYIETVSGVNKKNRKQFNAMMRACGRKKIDLIITKSISRFARNTLDFLEKISELKDLGVDVYFEKRANKIK